MKFYVGGNKIVDKNNNSIFGWSAVCKDGILVEMVIRSYRWQVLQVENSCVNGTDIK